MSKKKLKDMSKAEQRSALAKEVIKRIHSGDIRPKVGIYLRTLAGRDRIKQGEPCRACALGALNVAKYYLGGGEFPVFSKNQRGLIEGVFEGYSRSQWIAELPNDEDRMLAIMQNIIDHDGTFKPNVMYEVS